jgi:4-amino-4-deoxy-L-arabinose transferase-like glycosyltransferase
MAGRYPPDVPAAVQAAQCLVVVLAIPLAAALAGRAGGHRAGTIAAWIVALHPALSWIPAYALSEAVYVPLVLALAVIVGRVTDRRARQEGPAGEHASWTPESANRRTMALGGALCGVAALVRPSTIFFVPLLVAWLAWRRRWAWTLIFVAATAAPIVPWTVRNLLTLERPVFIASDGGVTFWTGNHPLARGEGDLAANPVLKEANLALRARYPGLSPEMLEPVYYREAFAWIREEPLAWLALVARKAFYAVVPIGPSYRLHSTPYLVASVVPYVILLLLAIPGTRAAARGPAPPVALLLLMASALAGSIIFLPQERFRIPIIDPGLAILASVWLARRTGAR